MSAIPTLLTCDLCGLPLVASADKEECLRLHAIEAHEVIKEDYRQFVKDTDEA